MATLTEGSYPGDIFLYEEDEHQLSRENITVLAGSGSARDLTRGMALAKLGALSVGEPTERTAHVIDGLTTRDLESMPLDQLLALRAQIDRGKR